MNLGRDSDGVVADAIRIVGLADGLGSELEHGTPRDLVGLVALAVMVEKDSAPAAGPRNARRMVESLVM